jgi:hypothetical protein
MTPYLNQELSILDTGSGGRVIKCVSFVSYEGQTVISVWWVEKTCWSYEGRTDLNLHKWQVLQSLSIIQRCQQRTRFKNHWPTLKQLHQDQQLHHGLFPPLDAIGHVLDSGQKIMKDLRLVLRHGSLCCACVQVVRLQKKYNNSEKCEDILLLFGCYVEDSFIDDMVIHSILSHRFIRYKDNNM